MGKQAESEENKPNETAKERQQPENKRLENGQKSTYLKAILIFALGVVLAETIFFIVIKNYVQTTALKGIVEDVTDCGSHFDTKIENLFIQMENAARYLNANGDLSDTVVKKVLNSFSEKEGLMEPELILKDGTVIRSEDMDEADVGDNANQISTVSISDNYIKEALSGSRSFGEAYVAGEENEYSVPAAVPVIIDGEVRAALKAVMDLCNICQFITDDEVGKSTTVVILDSGGHTVFTNRYVFWKSLTTGQDLLTYLKGKRLVAGADYTTLENDFKTHAAGYTEFKEKRGGESKYIVYQPVCVKDWQLIWCLKASRIEKAFSFILVGQFVLLAVHLILLGLLILYIMLKNRKRQEVLIEKANTDALTGLSNKKDTQAQIDEWISSPSCQMMQAFFMIDLDKFKDINDIHGHAVGDKVLQGIGRVLKESFRDNDVTGRIGGDEFVVLMRNVMSFDTVREKAEHLIAEIHAMDEQKLVPGNGISCSIGISFFPRDGRTYDELYKCGDNALYEAKNKGRDQYVILKSNSGGWES